MGFIEQAFVKLGTYQSQALRNQFPEMDSEGLPMLISWFHPKDERTSTPKVHHGLFVLVRES